MTRTDLLQKIRRTIPFCVIAVLILLISLPNLRSGNIDDLDSAHHLMDGYFFYDLLHGHVHGNPLHAVVTYHKQYPALGFLFWPPLVPFVLGIFDLFLGPHVLSARICWLFFGWVFAFGLYKILARELSRWMALAATCALVMLPGMFWSFNQVMLEMPTLAFMCVAVLAVRWMADNAAGPNSYPRAAICALACAAVIYAKQPAWFLYPALLLLVFRNPELRHKREAWAGIGLIAVFCIPLALYTVKYGHANMAQSVGSNTELIMPNYRSIPRWSLAAWTFYFKTAWTRLNPVVLVLGIGGILLGFKRSFRQRHLLWLAWFGFFWITFSFYDNRLERHATFWWPAWVALAAACLEWLLPRVPVQARRFAPIVLVLPAVWQLPGELRGNYSDFRDERPIVGALYSVTPDPGNILLYGPDKQTFIALIREYDTQRRDTAVRGERLLKQESVDEVCRHYRVGDVVVELAPGDSLDRHPELAGIATDKQFQPLFERTYLRRGQQMTVQGWRYTGPKDAKTADIPLSSDLL